MKLSALVGDTIIECSPDATVIDATGMGAGVYDRLIQLRHNVTGVLVGEKAEDSERYSNLRAELWWKMRTWLPLADLPAHDVELEADLCGIEYDSDQRDRMRLEKKSDMKKRGLASPDSGDALAMSFAVRPVAGRVSSVVRGSGGNSGVSRRNSWKVR